MAQQISMTDIARQLKVSRATVSQVLNERENNLITEATRARVLTAAREMGYRRNRAAQALAGHRSYVIELRVHRFHPAFYGRVLDAFDEQLRPTPYELHIANLPFDSDQEWPASDGAWPVDGIIADALLPDAALSSLRQRGVPIVDVGIRANTNTDHVLVDLTPALLGAIRHLAAHSSRVAHISPWPSARPLELPDPRSHVYCQVMQEAGLKEEVIVTPDSDRPAVRKIVREYITQQGCPDGIFCFNDESAIATLAALRDLDLRVPQDVMLIGCDGIEETAYHHPAISTIQYPFDEVARLAWEFLNRRLQQPDIPLQGATLTAELVLRESSAR